MASPFNVFRKHQKWMIATLGILAIFAFAIGDQLMQMVGSGGGGGQNPLVVTTAYGDMRESDLQRMRQSRRILQEYLYQLYQLGAQAGGIPQAFPIIDPRSQDTEQAAVDSMLLAKRGEELGIVVSDAVINDYLRRLTGNAVTPARMRELANGFALGNSKMTMVGIFEGIRQEMIARKVQEAYRMTTAATPAQQWKFYLQLNDRIRAQILPVKVEDFLDQVEDPTEAEIKAFYEQHKDTIDYRMIVGGVQMESAEPGFKIPARMAFQFVRADFDTAIDQAAEAITDEEIEQFYEDNKRLFPKATLLPEDEETAPDSPTTPGQPESDPTPAPEDSTPTDPADAPTTETPAKTPEPSAELPQAAPENGEPTPEDSDPPAPANTPTATEGAPPEPASDEPAAEESSQRRGSAPFQFAAYQADGETEPPADAADDAVEADAPADDAPAAIAPAADAPAGEPADSDTPAADVPQPDDTAAPATDDNATDGGEPEQQYQPLSEVRDIIRKRLADQRAAEKRDEMLEPIRAAMQRYNRERISLYSQVGDDDGPDSPAVKALRASDEQAMANIAKLAKEAGLEVEQTKLISFTQLDDIPLGKSEVVSDGQQFSRYAFSGLARDFMPTLSVEQGNGYVVWKIDDEPEQVPPLEDVRKDVVHELKMIEARKLAEQKAKELAEQVRKSGETLMDVFADSKQYKPFTTDLFSWRTQGAVPENPRSGRIRLSEVEGVVDAGPDFMEAVFEEIDNKGTGVAPNHSQTIYYVVDVVEHESTREALRENFLAGPGPWTQLASQANTNAVGTALSEELARRADVEWLRTPDMINR